MHRCFLKYFFTWIDPCQKNVHIHVFHNLYCDQVYVRMLNRSIHGEVPRNLFCFHRFRLYFFVKLSIYIRRQLLTLWQLDWLDWLTRRSALSYISKLETCLGFGPWELRVTQEVTNQNKPKHTSIDNTNLINNISRNESKENFRLSQMSQSKSGRTPDLKHDYRGSCC